ncbi:MAG: aminodeoxychorismate/anthranilate synthase component II [Candidatus Zixiibacteriota bacterium]
MNFLIIDNNDSFTLNLRHLIAQSDGRLPDVIPYEAINTADFAAYDIIVISPGPGKPEEYPNYRRLFESGKPIIGICLGMQVMAIYFGGEVDRLPDCFHGRTEDIEFDGKTLAVARYHSLAVTRVPDCFDVISRNSSSVPMAIAHKTLPIIGFQFHPESFLTENGNTFIDYALTFIDRHITRPV